MIDEVQSVLMSHLTSEMTTRLDDMVTFANSSFSTLNWIDVDYSSFYEDVKRDKHMCSVLELEKQG